MASSNLILFSITFAFLMQTSFGIDPLFHFCSNSSNFTAQSTYKSNLKTLMSSLIYKTTSTGFGIGSVGPAKYQNQKVYGLALCRGDVSNLECKTCVSQASKEVLNLCPYNKGAIVWYDNCMIKYLNTNFFGKIDNANKFSLLNVENVANPTKFNNMSKDLLSLLANEASMDHKFYASGELKIGESHRVYGLSQCTRDLSSVDCKKCLDDAISELIPNGKKGGRVVGGSCNIRYEIYPFVEE
ncbi:cysteine-rich repeat secretory protein 38-like [Trifolium pratense]|uniref:cysteine-rich repeat secretory protein 38-like n=1 Tax=Trifolium pratense TaxID=57577 RepID=UPI001E692046|nr:cysteine-rich repeat secretory protein 38-like [Trifolium pratense]